jgi:hypothetical protein
MAEILSLLQDAAQVARRCPNPTLVRAYLRAARKFCTQSRWLRRELTVGTEAGETLYDLVPGTGDPLLEIIGVRVVTGVDPAQPRQGRWPINPNDPMAWRPSQPGRPTEYCYVPEDQISVNAPPDRVYTLTVTVECQPLLGSTVLPDDLLRKWDTALTDGALAYLLNLPGQPWSQPNLGRTYAVSFQAAINNAKADVARAYNTGTVMARIPRKF